MFFCLFVILELISSSMKEDGISVSVDGSLVISHAERKHHGKYTCTATNEVGSVEATCQVVVEGENTYEPRHVISINVAF